MNKKHEKSACCRAATIKYGRRRYQCGSCKKTWRVWKHARGRKKKRINRELATRFLNRETISILKTAAKRQRPESTLQDALKRSRDEFLLRSLYAPIPEGDLILIADAVIERVSGKWLTVYLMLLRNTVENDAVILPPLFRKGTETYDGWWEALETMPDSANIRIKALVCDGHSGLVGEAKWRKWVLQRRHFHLLAKIQSRRSLSWIARNKKEARIIFSHVRNVLNGSNENSILDSLTVLEEISWISSSPMIRAALSGFVKHSEDYRAYVKYPELHLPITNNAAESLAGLIADLKSRLRGFKTEASLKKWISALLKFKKKIKCNGYQPN